ncbi:MAG TPA: SDR family oxidoreductase [Candidatus Acidoferrales bacterium]|nr:SDR family oxidoreductase [Candidatus Acidoferrales bacterium]
MSIALITGASTGIGLATAVALARGGHAVHATMRQPDRSPELGAIAAKERLPITIGKLDVDDDNSVNGAVAEALALHRRIDVLVNNAGIDSNGPIEELPLAEFRRVMETNYFGALRMIKAILPGMRERGSGCIVNVTSVAGRIAAAPQASYAASKWALEAASEILAQEVKPFNIRVAIVEPGVIDTPIFAKMGEARHNTRYPHERRIRALFAARLKDAVPPSVVGEKIREIVESGTWQLRHPAGPDAEPLLRSRAALTDEQWVAAQAASDEEWALRIKANFGLDVGLGPAGGAS